MRVTCTFVSLSIFFAAQSQCAPIDPLNALGQHGLPALGGLPLAGSLPITGITNSIPKMNSLPSVGSLPVIGSAPVLAPNALLAGPLTGLPNLGGLNTLTGLSDTLPVLNSKRDLLGLGSGLLGNNKLPVVGALPALEGIPLTSGGILPSLTPITGSLPAATNLGGVTPLPGLGSVSALKSLPAVGTLPNLNSVGLDSLGPMVGNLPILNSKRGLSDLTGSILPNGQGSPVLSTLKNVSLLNNGLPIAGSPMDLVNGISHGAGGSTPLAGIVGSN